MQSYRFCINFSLPSSVWEWERVYDKVSVGENEIQNVCVRGGEWAQKSEREREKASETVRVREHAWDKEGGARETVWVFV
jgi:hypothetical protein